MIPQRLDSPDVCGLSEKWGISMELATALARLQQKFPFRLKIFSGYRTAETHAAQGPTKAPDSLSTHRSCPATGADVQVDWGTLAVPFPMGGSIGVPLPIPLGMQLGMNDFPTNSMKKFFGDTVESVGLRWGGGAPRTAEGIPVEPEWHHVDLGPRKRT